MIIPRQLQDKRYRFYLVGKNSKIPMLKAWNTDNNYRYDNIVLKIHTGNGGNYGVCTGYGDLIVLDFDSEAYWLKVRHNLPQTFTVLSAGKQLPHMYYRLTDGMIKKTGIDSLTCKNTGETTYDQEKISNIKGRMSKQKFDARFTLSRVCDIQAARSGVVGPGSVVGRRYYEPLNDHQITEITKDTLMKALQLNTVKTYDKNCQYNGPDDASPENVKKSVETLLKAGIPRTKMHHFQCPLHDMVGTGNLVVMPNGRLYCFHCQKMWPTAQDLLGEIE